MQRRRSQGWVAPTPTLSHRLYPLLSLRQTPRQALPPGGIWASWGEPRGVRHSGGCQPGGHRGWTLSGWCCQYTVTDQTSVMTWSQMILLYLDR